MKKFWLCLISAILFFLSCDIGKETIRIEWAVACDISEIDFKKMPVILDFWSTNYKKEFLMTPYKTQKIKIPKEVNMTLRGKGWRGAHNMEIYPDSFSSQFPEPIRSEYFGIREFGAIEIFLYELRLLEVTENNITLAPHEKVLAYFYSFFVGSREYMVFSKSNIINLDIDTITRIDIEDPTPVKVFRILQESGFDTCYYYVDTLWDDEYISLANRDKRIGYIVNSKLSDTGVMFLDNIGVYKGLY